MRDADLRTLERAWRRTPLDTAALSKLVAARWRVVGPAAEPLPEPPRLAPRGFDADVKLYVFAGDETFLDQPYTGWLVGSTDRRFGSGAVAIPSCRRWWVTPDQAEFGAGIELVRARGLPGLRLDALSADERLALRAVSGLESLRWVQVGGWHGRDEPCSDEDLAFVATLPSIEELRVYNGAGLTSVSLEVFAERPRLAALKLDHLDAKAFAGGVLARLETVRKLDVWSSDLGRAGLRDVAELEGLVDFATNAVLADDDYAALGGMRSLASLKLAFSRERSTEAALVHLWPLGQLTTLHVTHEVELGTLGLTSLGALRNLRQLSLAATTIPSLAPLAMLDRLERLTVEAGDPGERGWLEPLSGLPLRELDLSRARLPAAAFATVGKIATLRRLSFRGLTDKALKTVAELHGLEELDLRGNKVTEAGLAHLDGLKRLRFLGVPDQRKLKRFRKTHPDCEIESEY